MIGVVIPLEDIPDSYASSPIVVGDQRVLSVIAGDGVTAAAKRALDDGKVVAFDEAAISRGTVRVDAGGKQRHLPAVALPITQSVHSTGGAMMSAAAAKAQGFRASSAGTLVLPRSMPSQDAEDKAAAIMDGVSGSVYVERGYQSNMGVVAAGLSGASGIVTIAGVAIAVGLAAAEGRADLATLGAIGAEPRRRRQLAMAQASVVGVVGCVVGTAFGLFVATVMLSGFEVQPWAVPWTLLIVVTIGVPVLAMLVAGACTRSRLPMVRRLA